MKVLALSLAKDDFELSPNYITARAYAKAAIEARRAKLVDEFTVDEVFDKVEDFLKRGATLVRKN